MPTYEVTICRSEYLTLRLDAADPMDADARAMRDGDEVMSKSIDQGETVEIREVSA